MNRRLVLEVRFLCSAFYLGYSYPRRTMWTRRITTAATIGGKVRVYNIYAGAARYGQSLYRLARYTNKMYIRVMFHALLSLPSFNLLLSDRDKHYLSFTFKFEFQSSLLSSHTDKVMYNYAAVNFVAWSYNGLSFTLGIRRSSIIIGSTN